MSAVRVAMSSRRNGLERLQRLRGSSPFKSEVFKEFPPEEEILSTFHGVWAGIEENLDLSLTSDEAIRLFPSLTLYDVPDGTRSTLTVRPDIDVGVDAALYCLALIHTLKNLGARHCIIMTHTVYNRKRGPEGLGRIFRLLADGVKPIAEYSRQEKIGIHLVGLKRDYELRNYLLGHLQEIDEIAFRAYFLVDYAEEISEDPELRRDLELLPDVDVCVRHTKLNLSGGGWIPTKLLKSTFMYCQNGTLYSNWAFDELVAFATLSLVAKLMHTGEGLVKMYGDIDEVKARYQLRELRLFNKRVYLREPAKKLFLFGSPHGIYQFYY
ncbi:MAG: hypothetical protein V3U52_04355 [Thermoplasmata archaeon]